VKTEADISTRDTNDSEQFAMTVGTGCSQAGELGTKPPTRAPLRFFPGAMTCLSRKFDLMHLPLR
jgi:hypothetical protein